MEKLRTQVAHLGAADLRLGDIDFIAQNVDRPGDFAGQSVRHLFQHHRKGSGSGQRNRIIAHPAGIGAAPLHPVAAQRIDRLRGQTHMAHHRNAARGQEGDGFGHMFATLQLHRRRAGFLHQPCRRAERLLAAFLVRAERHVDHQHRPVQPARHRLSVHHHHLHRHRQGRGQSVQHHADAVADQHDIAMRIDQPGDGSGIGGQHHQRHAALAGADIRGGEAPGLARRTHDPALPSQGGCGQSSCTAASFPAIDCGTAADASPARRLAGRPARR